MIGVGSDIPSKCLLNPSRSFLRKLIVWRSASKPLPFLVVSRQPLDALKGVFLPQHIEVSDEVVVPLQFAHGDSTAYYSDCVNNGIEPPIAAGMVS